MGNIRPARARIGIRRWRMQRRADFPEKREARIGTSKEKIKRTVAKLSTFGLPVADSHDVGVLAIGLGPGIDRPLGAAGVLHDDRGRVWLPAVDEDTARHRLPEIIKFDDFVWV